MTINQIINNILAIPTQFLFWVLFILFGAGGCSQGAIQWYEKSEPQTIFALRYNPFTGVVEPYFASNDGRTITFDEASGSRGADGVFTFVIKNFNTTERSVENRGAAAIQDTAWFGGASQLATAHWNGATALATAIAPTLTEWVKAHPQSAKNPDILRGVVDSLAKEAVTNGIMPTP